MEQEAEKHPMAAGHDAVGALLQQHYCQGHIV